MEQPHITEEAGGREDVFCLLWGLHLGDQFELVDGRVYSVYEGRRGTHPVPDECLVTAGDLGLIEFEEVGDRVVTRLTERGRFSVHKWGERRFGKRRWERERRERKWVMRIFDLDAAIAEMFQPAGGK